MLVVDFLSTIAAKLGINLTSTLLADKPVNLTLQIDKYGNTVDDYTALTTSKKVSEVDPLDNRDGLLTLLDTTNLPVGTYWYPSSTGLNVGSANAGGGNAKNISLTFGTITADDNKLTLTVEGTNDEDSSTAFWAPIRFSDHTEGSNNLSVEIGSTSGAATTSAARQLDIDYHNCNLVRVKLVVEKGAGALGNTVLIKGRVTAL